MNQPSNDLYDQHPWLLVLLFELLHIAICFPTRQFSYIRKYILGPLMIAFAYNMYTKLHLHVKNRYAVGFHITFQLCSMICLVYVKNGFPDVWHRVKDDPSGSQISPDDERLPSNFPFKRKIGWMMDLTFSPRRVGWIQEPKHALPSHPTCSRRFFVGSRILYALVNVVLMDLAVSYEAGNPSFDTRLHAETDSPNAYMAARAFWPRLPDIVAWTVAMVNGICLAHTAIAIPSVVLGLSQPGDWPSMFGSFWDSYTVRQFWGKSWHQRLRPMFSMTGQHVAHTVCGFKPGTMASSYTQLFVAFLVSGLMHTGGDYMVFRRFTTFSLRFFLLQAVAISIEDFVIWLTKPLWSQWDTRIRRTIGYIWVLGSFCFTAPMWLDPMSVAKLHLVDTGDITAKVLDFWTSHTTSAAPMWLNPLNFTGPSAISPIVHRAMNTDAILGKALEVCINPGRYVTPQWLDTLSSV